MLDCRKVAITGEVASGKTTLLGFFEELGAETVDADKIVHKLLSSHTPLGKKVIALLGDEIVEEGELSRQKIANKVFSDPSKLAALEEIIHPAVQQEIDRLYAQTKAPLFVAEMPLLFEAHLQDNYDTIIVITSHLPKSEEMQTREKRLLPIEQKCASCDFHVANEEGINELFSNAETIYDHLTQEK